MLWVIVMFEDGWEMFKDKRVNVHDEPPTFSDFWRFSSYWQQQNLRGLIIHDFTVINIFHRLQGQFRTPLFRRNRSIENCTIGGFQECFLTITKQKKWAVLYRFWLDTIKKNHFWTTTLQKMRLGCLTWLLNADDSQCNGNTKSHQLGRKRNRQFHHERSLELSFGTGKGFYGERHNNQFWCVLCELGETLASPSKQMAWPIVFICDIAPWRCKVSCFCTNRRCNKGFWIRTTWPSTFIS